MTSKSYQCQMQRSFLMLTILVCIKLAIQIALYILKVSGDKAKIEIIATTVIAIAMIVWIAVINKFNNRPTAIITTAIAALVCYPYFVELGLHIQNDIHYVGMEFLLMSHSYDIIFHKGPNWVMAFEGVGCIYCIIRIMIRICSLDRVQIGFSVYCLIIVCCIQIKKALTRLLLGKHHLAKIAGYKQQLSLLKLIINTIPNGIFAVKDDNICYINSNVNKFYGQAFTPKELKNAIYCFLNNCDNSPESTMKMQDNKDVLVSKQSLNGYTIYVLTDITDSITRKAKAIKAEHWKKTMLSFAHEFRTPLNWLIGTLSTVTQNCEDELLKMAFNAANSILFSVNNLIFFNELQDRKYSCRVFPISDTINACIKYVEIENMFNKNSCIVSVKDDSVDRVYGDAVLYTHVLTNILINASKSIKNGSIYIRTEINGEYLYTYVSDRGEMLSKEEISDILVTTPDISSKEVVQLRHGISLKFCKPFCKKMNGDFNISSTPSHGTSYTFWIKIDNSAAKMLNLDKKLIYNNSIELVEKTENAHHILTSRYRTLSTKNITFLHSQSATNSSKKILIVDDTPLNLYVLKKMLQNLHLEAVEKANGKEALEAVMQHYLDYSIIFMDINMPVMDGIEATKQIKGFLKSNYYSNIPIIALSAQDDTELVRSAFNAGFEEYLVKPISMPSLKSLLCKYNIING